MKNQEIVIGFHSVESLIKHKPGSVLEVVAAKGKSGKRMESLEMLIKQNQIKIRYQSGDELDLLSHRGRHQGVVAIVTPSGVGLNPKTDLQQIVAADKDQSIILALDQVQDPNNLGACLRTAECAGVDAVILPKDGSCRVNETVRKVASGAVENLNIYYVANLAGTMDKCQRHGFWAYGAAAQGMTSLFQCSFSEKVLVVVGAEGTGLRRLTRKKCDYLVNIPIQGETPSLNVSVATGVFLFEIRRQWAGGG